MGRKSMKKRPKNGYKKGHVPWHAGKKLEFTKIPKPEPYSRLSLESFESRVNEYPNGIMAIHNVDGTMSDGKILRPLSKSSEVVDMYLQPSDSHPDEQTYKIFQQGPLQAMMNSEMKNHRLHKNDCEGDLRFDTESHKKWGLAWTERFICDECGFTSKFYDLFEPIETGKRGRRAAKINIAAQVGLMHTPISNKSFSEILNCANIISPAASGMYKCSNKVSEQVEKINREDMKNIRKKLLEENKLCGLKNDDLVRVETDARYNNPLFSGGTTPFQGGTQVTQVMCENMTKNKKIVALFTGNKLCTVASRLRGKGLEVECPNHEGNCTANIPEDAPIGNEAEYSSKCAQEVSDYLKISHVTTDGDSKAYTGVTRVHGPKVESLKDVRHMSQSLKRAIMKCTFSTNLFSGINKLNKKSRFAMDIKARCVAELNKSFSVHRGELYLIKAHMPEVIKTIIMCYKGYCGSTCRINSYVCGGVPSKHWQKQYIAYGETCKMTCDDEEKLVKCIKILLGPKSLDLVRYLTSTQKSEAFNRSLSRCNPKNVTFTRNFSGRAHAAVHMRNNHYVNSILILTQKLGAGVTPGSTVAAQLKQRYRREMYSRKYKRLQSSKLKRAITRNRKFDMHACLNYPLPIFYQKGISDPTYDDSGITFDHDYSKKHM